MKIRIQEIRMCRDSLIPCLVATVDFKNDEPPLRYVLIVNTDLRLSIPGDPSEKTSLIISYGNSEIIARGFGHNESTTLDFKFPLTTRILEEIEIRRKKDLGFVIFAEWLHVRGEIEVFSYQAIEKRFTWSSDHGPYIIPQSRWLDILEEMGYSTTKIFELSMPSIPVANPFIKASEYLEKAHQFYLKHNYKETLTNCRLCHEELEEIIKKYNQRIVDYLDIHCQGTPLRSKKFLETQTKIKQFCHMGPHSGYYIEQKDAELSLQATLSVTKYLFDIITETEKSVGP